MEKVAIIVDSCADLPREYQEQYDIFVLPLIIRVQDEVYKDGIDITVEEVYERQKTETLKTSSPEGKDIIELFDEIKNKGYTHAIGAILSAGLSGTYNQIRLLAMDYEGMEIEIFDSCSGSLGTGIIGISLAKYRDEGMSFEQLKKKAAELIEDTTVFFSLDSLELLEKGGRVGKATAFVGGVVKIKPILSFDRGDGELTPVAKVRGKKRVQPKLIQMIGKCIEEHPDQPFNLAVASGGMEEECDQLEAAIKEAYPQYCSFTRGKIGGTLSVYVGPGLLGAGIQFLRDEN